MKTRQEVLAYGTVLDSFSKKVQKLILEDSIQYGHNKK